MCFSLGQSSDRFAILRNLLETHTRLPVRRPAGASVSASNSPPYLLVLSAKTGSVAKKFGKIKLAGTAACPYYIHKRYIQIQKISSPSSFS